MILRNVLAKNDLADLRALAIGSTKIQGAATASGVARSVKHNQHAQLDADNARALTQTVTSSLRRHPYFFRAALPKLISVPAINTYASGMDYGCHFDLPLQYSADGTYVRADLSATLFLSSPEEYEGGELQFTQDGQIQAIKENAGDLVLYPSGLLHRVTPVIRGVRHAVIFWVQSMIRDNRQRWLVFACDELVERISRKLPDSEEVRDLTGLFVNLTQLWLDP